MTFREKWDWKTEFDPPSCLSLGLMLVITHILVFYSQKIPNIGEDLSMQKCSRILAV